jgi:hypothetical protein
MCIYKVLKNYLFKLINNHIWCKLFNKAQLVQSTSWWIATTSTSFLAAAKINRSLSIPMKTVEPKLARSSPSKASQRTFASWSSSIYRPTIFSVLWNLIEWLEPSWSMIMCSRRSARKPFLGSSLNSSSREKELSSRTCTLSNLSQPINHFSEGARVGYQVQFWQTWPLLSPSGTSHSSFSRKANKSSSLLRPNPLQVYPINITHF